MGLKDSSFHSTVARSVARTVSMGNGVWKGARRGPAAKGDESKRLAGAKRRRPRRLSALGRDLSAGAARATRLPGHPLFGG